MTGNQERRVEKIRVYPRLPGGVHERDMNPFQRSCLGDIVRWANVPKKDESTRIEFLVKAAGSALDQDRFGGLFVGQKGEKERMEMARKLVNAGLKVGRPRWVVDRIARLAFEGGEAVRTVEELRETFGVEGREEGRGLFFSPVKERVTAVLAGALVAITSCAGPVLPSDTPRPAPITETAAAPTVAAPTESGVEVNESDLPKAIEDQGLPNVEAPALTFSEIMTQRFEDVLAELGLYNPESVVVSNKGFLPGEGDRASIVYVQLADGKVILSQGGMDSLAERLVNSINENNKDFSVSTFLGLDGLSGEERDTKVRAVIAGEVLIADGGWHNQVEGREILRKDGPEGEVMARASQDTGWRFEVSEGEVANWQSVVEVLMPNIGGTEISSPLRENIIYNISERAKRDGHIESLDELRANGEWVFRLLSDRENDSTLVETGFGIYEWYLDAGLGVWRIRPLEETVIMLDEAGMPIESLNREFGFSGDGKLSVRVTTSEGELKGEFERVPVGENQWEWQLVEKGPLTSEELIAQAPEVPGTQKAWDETAERVVYVENGVEVGGFYVWGEAENQRGIGLRAEFLARNYPGKMPIPVDPSSIPEGSDISWKNTSSEQSLVLFFSYNGEAIINPEIVLVNPLINSQEYLVLTSHPDGGFSIGINRGRESTVLVLVGEGSNFVSGEAIKSGVGGSINYGDPLCKNIVGNPNVKRVMGADGVAFTIPNGQEKIWKKDNIAKAGEYEVFILANK